ncbi:hypothetical protein QYE76_050950 [Lolium multiflorum]|uniref:Transposon protein, putative, CACTA, En/Spm sub-class n=1 Tax=Lolium multiflorum TaxID=4521 RepID=A0AAD8SR03_LOLMU|nr:hypothetical protein QYE76_050950 [Lolium multiflorum]
MPSYYCWTKHGERGVMMEDNEEEEEDDDGYPNFPEYDDTAEGNEDNEVEDQEAPDEPADDDLGRAIADARRECETEKERLAFDKMIEDHNKLLYPTCEDGHKKLGSTLELLQWKAENGVTDSGFGKLLTIIKRKLPRGNELPASTYEAKKIVCPLGLDVQKIHACINDCILYRGEYENLDACPVCTALRYKIRRDDPGDVEGERPRKRVPAKVMWYAPIIPRLKRLFRNKEHARLLRWHKEDRKKDVMLRHPADGSQWRKIDREFPNFAQDARNLRNPSNEIFSESDEINALFYRKHPEHTRTAAEGGRPPHHTQRPRGAPPRVWTPVSPPRRLSAYKSPDLKTSGRSTKTTKPSRAAAIKPRSGDSLFRHPAGRGSAPEGFSIDTAAISTAIFITAAAPMRRE